MSRKKAVERYTEVSERKAIIAHLFRAMRKELGISQEVAAKYIGTSAQQVWLIEHGRTQKGKPYLLALKGQYANIKHGHGDWLENEIKKDNIPASTLLAAVQDKPMHHTDKAARDITEDDVQVFLGEFTESEAPKRLKVMARNSLEGSMKHSEPLERYRMIQALQARADRAMDL